MLETRPPADIPQQSGEFFPQAYDPASKYHRVHPHGAILEFFLIPENGLPERASYRPRPAKYPIEPASGRLDKWGHGSCGLRPGGGFGIMNLQASAGVHE